MKKYLLLLLLLFPGISFASLCDISDFSTQNDTGNTGNYSIAGGGHTMAVDCQVTNLQMFLQKNGSPTDRGINVYADNGGLPGTILFTSNNLGAITGYQWQSVGVPGGQCISAGTVFYVGIDKSISDIANVTDYSVGFNGGGNSFYYNNGSWGNAGSETVLWEVDGTLAPCGGGGGGGATGDLFTPTGIFATLPPVLSPSFTDTVGFSATSGIGFMQQVGIMTWWDSVFLFIEHNSSIIPWLALAAIIIFPFFAIRYFMPKYK